MPESPVIESESGPQQQHEIDVYQEASTVWDITNLAEIASAHMPEDNRCAANELLTVLEVRREAFCQGERSTSGRDPEGTDSVLGQLSTMLLERNSDILRTLALPPQIAERTLRISVKLAMREAQEGEYDNPDRFAAFNIEKCYGLTLMCLGEVANLQPVSPDEPVFKDPAVIVQYHPAHYLRGLLKDDRCGLTANQRLNVIEHSKANPADALERVYGNYEQLQSDALRFGIKMARTEITRAAMTFEKASQVVPTIVEMKSLYKDCSFVSDRHIKEACVRNLDPRQVLSDFVKRTPDLLKTYLSQGITEGEIADVSFKYPERWEEILNKKAGIKKAKKNKSNTDVSEAFLAKITQSPDPQKAHRDYIASLDRLREICDLNKVPRKESVLKRMAEKGKSYTPEDIQLENRFEDLRIAFMDDKEVPLWLIRLVAKAYPESAQGECKEKIGNLAMFLAGGLMHALILNESPTNSTEIPPYDPETCRYIVFDDKVAEALTPIEKRALAYQFKFQELFYDQDIAAELEEVYRLDRLPHIIRNTILPKATDAIETQRLHNEWAQTLSQLTTRLAVSLSPQAYQQLLAHFTSPEAPTEDRPIPDELQHALRLIQLHYLKYCEKQPPDEDIGHTALCMLLGDQRQETEPAPYSEVLSQMLEVAAFEGKKILPSTIRRALWTKLTLLSHAIPDVKSPSKKREAAKTNEYIEQLPMGEYIRPPSRQLEMLTPEMEVHYLKLLEAGVWAQGVLDGETNVNETTLQGYTIGGYLDEFTFEKDLKDVIKQGERARERLTESCMRLVISLAQKYQGRGLALDDLIQEGNIGLLHGIKKFDFTQGVRLGTYVDYQIRHHLQRALENTSRTIRLPINTYKKVRAMEKAESEILKRKQRSATIAELAEALGISPAKVIELKKYTDAISYDGITNQDGTPFETAALRDIESENAFEKVIEPTDTIDARHELNTKLRFAIRQVHFPKEKPSPHHAPQRAIRILELAFGLQVYDSRPLGNREIATELGIGKDAVAYSLKKSMELLKSSKEFEEELPEFLRLSRMVNR